MKWQGTRKALFLLLHLPKDVFPASFQKKLCMKVNNHENLSQDALTSCLHWRVLWLSWYRFILCTHFFLFLSLLQEDGLCNIEEIGYSFVHKFPSIRTRLRCRTTLYAPGQVLPSPLDLSLGNVLDLFVLYSLVFQLS